MVQTPCVIEALLLFGRRCEMTRKERKKLVFVSVDFLGRGYKREVETESLVDSIGKYCGLNCIFRTDDTVQWHFGRNRRARDTIHYLVYTRLCSNQATHSRTYGSLSPLPRMTPALSFEKLEERCCPSDATTIGLNVCPDRWAGGCGDGGGDWNSPSLLETSSRRTHQNLHQPSAQSIRMSCREKYFVNMHVKHAGLFTFEYHQFYTKIDRSNRVLDYWNSIRNGSN